MLICPYCGNEKQEWQIFGCCGENHFVEEDAREEAQVECAKQVSVPVETLLMVMRVLTFLKGVLIGLGYQKDSSSIHQLEIAYSMLRAATKGEGNG